MLKRHTPLVSDTSCRWSRLIVLSQPLAETVLLWRKTWQLKRSFTFQVIIVAGKFSMIIIIIIMLSSDTSGTMPSSLSVCLVQVQAVEQQSVRKQHPLLMNERGKTGAMII